MRRARLEFWAFVRATLLSMLFAGVLANVVVGTLLHGGAVAQLVAWIAALAAVFPFAFREAHK
jgi:uncharacterized membrane protein YhaH (DUF805 family)